jgi:single-strand DNA-binding protein
MASKTTRTRTAKQPVQTEVPGTEKNTRSASVNKVTLVGRLVAAPEMRTTGSGLHVTTVRVVTNDRETPEFHDVVLWRQLADFAVNYMAKGRLVFVEGRLQSRTWQAADGTKRRSVEVVADRFQAPSSPRPEQSAAA